MNPSNILKINSDLPINSGSFHFFIKISPGMQKKTLDKAGEPVYPEYPRYWCRTGLF